MSLLSYQLQIKRYLRELGLSTRDFNKLDVEHSDVNLIKHLQILNPIIVASAPPPPPPPSGNTGFWGTFQVFNQRGVGSIARHMHVYLAYNDVALTSSQQINSNDDYTFNLAEAARLPLPSSILQLKITMQNGTQEITLDTIDGFEVESYTGNPLDEENTLGMLVNIDNYDNGTCIATIVVVYDN